MDDLFIAGVERRIQECKKMLATKFEMKDLGLMHYYLDREVWQRPGEIYLGQGKYIVKLLQKFGMMDSKSVTTPMITNLKKLRGSDSNLVDPTSYQQLVSSLMYLVNTKPDIYFALNILSQIQLEPHHDHWIAAKHILTYLRGTIHHCLKYDSKEIKLIGFTESDWGGYETNGRSTIGGCFSLGAAMISWMSRKQDHIALNSAEAEYVAACEIGKEVVWLRKLLTYLFEKSLGPTVINCDNQSCIKMSGDPMFHSRMKHINNKFHFIRNLVQGGIVKLEYVSTDEQVIDILTKALPNKKFEYLRNMLGLVDIVDCIDDKSVEEIC